MKTLCMQCPCLCVWMYMCVCVCVNPKNPPSLVKKAAPPSSSHLVPRLSSRLNWPKFHPASLLLRYSSSLSYLFIVFSFFFVFSFFLLLYLLPPPLPLILPFPLLPNQVKGHHCQLTVTFDLPPPLSLRITSSPSPWADSPVAGR